MEKDDIGILLKEAKKALKSNDVPVAAIIRNNKKILVKSHNRRELKNKISEHAEISAIDKLCKKIKTWHLNDVVLITTLEPCLMCVGAIIQARIKQVIYLVKNDKYGASDILVKNGVKVAYEYNEEAKQLIQDFFKEKRK